ncbi:hypothetical protein M3P21_21045 [Ruegeria sp. 2012CJ41-6]|uniref:Uncharacterized protein n=1 Tax=Ruegeria spongiae TaxID=2942209 RepID=A0ABT0Q808_9RHOB|nr:hypothetical protein [Ruegeria spongiae]MCL6286006.1 hypothetical protein [Ruegeria spongiae]
MNAQRASATNTVMLDSQKGTGPSDKTQAIKDEKLKIEVDAMTLSGLTKALDALTWDDNGMENPEAVSALIRTINTRSEALMERIEQLDI